MSNRCVCTYVCISFWKKSGATLQKSLRLIDTQWPPSGGCHFLWRAAVKKELVIKAQVVFPLLCCCFSSHRRGGGEGGGSLLLPSSSFSRSAEQLMQRRFLAPSGEEEVAADVGAGVISNLDLLGRRCRRHVTPLFCLALFFRSGKEKKRCWSLWVGEVGGRARAPPTCGALNNGFLLVFLWPLKQTPQRRPSASQISTVSPLFFCLSLNAPFSRLFFTHLIPRHLPFLRLCSNIALNFKACVVFAELDFKTRGKLQSNLEGTCSRGPGRGCVLVGNGVDSG